MTQMMSVFLASLIVFAVGCYMQRRSRALARRELLAELEGISAELASIADSIADIRIAFVGEPAPEGSPVEVGPTPIDPGAGLPPSA